MSSKRKDALSIGVFQLSCQRAQDQRTRDACSGSDEAANEDQTEIPQRRKLRSGAVGIITESQAASVKLIQQMLAKAAC